MKAIFKAALGSLLAAAVLTAAGSAALAEDAYPVLPLNSEDYDIASIYFADSLLTEDTVNPATVAPYTADELSTVKEAEAVEAPDDALVGIEALSTGDMFWYDPINAAALLSHADPLTLDAETGILSTAEGEEAAKPMVSAYSVLPLNSEDYDIAAIYFADSLLTTDTVNPATVAAYTEEELDTVCAADPVAAPADAVVGIQALSVPTVFWYDAEQSAAILSHADPLTLDAETGILSTAEGEEVASPIVLVPKEAVETPAV